MNKYQDEVQTEYDTDGHQVHDSEGVNYAGGIELPAALAIAKMADKEIATLQADKKELWNQLEIMHDAFSEDMFTEPRRKLEAVLEKHRSK